jgi:hypothetical protein
MIGVIDFDKQKNSRNSYNSTNNSICYYSQNGNIYPGANNSGGGKLKIN